MTSTPFGAASTEGGDRSRAWGSQTSLGLGAASTLSTWYSPFPVGMLGLRASAVGAAQAVQRPMRFLTGWSSVPPRRRAGHRDGSSGRRDLSRGGAERDVDLIVVGWHGHRPGTRLLVGSVGAHVVAAANRSVTVVHQPFYEPRLTGSVNVKQVRPGRDATRMRAAVVGDDPMDRGKAEAGPLVLGREEGVEDRSSSEKPGPVVLDVDLEDDPSRPGTQRRAGLASFLHRLDGVAGQVEQYLT